MNFEPLLKFGVDQGASAIHLQAESPPQLRIGGLIRNVEGPPLKSEEMRACIASLAPKWIADDLDRSLPLGAVFSAATASGRFRCTIYSHLGGPGLVLRVIPASLPSFEELHLPTGVRQLALAGRGLTVVVGPSGSGTSTTLAAMVDLINSASYQKIVTIEAPVEFLHANKKALITQMEVGLNATSFEHGLRLALQQDADVVVVADLRDAAAVRLALAAAESGRKVLAALPGLYAIQTITRLIAMVPPEERETTTSRLATSLDGVIAQRLANTRDGKHQPAVEVLRGGMNVARSLLENRLGDLRYFMEGREGGMQSLDQHLIQLHQSGVISGTETMRLASNPEAVAGELRALRQAAV